MKVQSYNITLNWNDYHFSKLYSDDLPINVKNLLNQFINEIEIYYNERAIND
jgi:hypothetical protein